MEFTVHDFETCFHIFFLLSIFAILSYFKKASYHWKVKRSALGSAMKFAKDNLVFGMIVILSLIIVFVYSAKFSGGLVIFLVCLVIYGCTSVLEPIIFPKKPNNVEISRCIEEDNLNLGTCFAVSFYEQYLRFVLPGLAARVEDQKSEMEHPDPLVVKKLIVLIPDSAKIEYDTLTDVDSYVTVSHTLVPVERNVCGHHKRTHVNTVYYIESMNIYCVAEFANPLQTFYKMKVYGEFNDHLMKQHVMIFYEKLKELLTLHRKETQNACVPVLYQDTGEPHLLSEVLTQACHDLQTN